MVGRFVAFTFGVIAGAVVTAVGVMMREEQKRSGNRTLMNPQEGDFIQWESGGKFNFQEPKRILEIVDGERGKFVFVEDSGTGIPWDEVLLVKKGSPPCSESFSDCSVSDKNKNK